MDDTNPKREFRIPDLIAKKRDGGELSDGEMKAFIRGVAAGDVSPAQTGQSHSDSRLGLELLAFVNGNKQCFPKNFLA